MVPRVSEEAARRIASYFVRKNSLLVGGLQQVRVLFFDNTIQTATLNTWTIGLTVLFTSFLLASYIVLYSFARLSPEWDALERPKT